MPIPPTMIGWSARIRAPRAKRRLAALIAVALTLATGCGEGDDSAEPSATESTIPTEVAEPLTLGAKLVRSRRDEANERLRIELTNLGEQPVPIDELRLVAPPYSPEPGEIRSGQLNPGQTIAFRITYGDPECAGDDPAPGQIQVEVTSGDQQVTVDPGESSDLIQSMLTADCARQRILEVVNIRFDTEWDVHSNGNEQVGTLLLERKAGGPQVTLTGVRGGINYTLEMLDPDADTTLAADEQTLTIPVRSRGARCDGHAMGDNSKPFGFAAWISLDGGPETLVEFTADEQPDNFLRLCS